MNKSREAKERRRKKAEELQKARASRTDAQQLAKLDEGGFAAAIERRKLQRRIKESQK